jgi:hypothetical protein
MEILSEKFTQDCNPNYYIHKFIAFIVSLIIFIKIFNLNVQFMEIKAYNLRNYSNFTLNSPFFKKNEKSTKKLVIALPFDSEIYKTKFIYITLNSIVNLNYNYTLYLVYNKKRPKFSKKKNIVFIQKDFNSIFMAFNLILDSINGYDYDYITFLTPGDFLKPTAYDFLENIEEHDIYQINKKDKSPFYYEKIPNKEYNYILNISIYDLNSRIPNNNYVVYDKIYKISLLKINNIRFIIHEKSLYYFNLFCFSYANDLLYINIYGLLHTQIPSSKLNSKFNNNIFQEAIIFNKIISANKNITKKIIEDMNKIDYVFPYVTSDDPYWKHLYTISLSGQESEYEAGIQRFRDNGLLKYLFRSLEKYLPWINKVHMIVMCDSQVPKWINRQKVHIIYHSDFIPKNYLPTFSSSLIECFLPFLPLVEEKFIYGNDDLIPCRNLSKKIFFYGNIPCYNINLRDYFETAPGDTLRRNAYNIIIGKKQNKRVVSTQHSTISYKLSSIKNCFKKYKKFFLNSLSKFREEKNLNQYIYAFYQMIEDTIFNKRQKIGAFIVKPSNIEQILNKNFSKYDFVCLNDEIEMTENDWNKILSKFEKQLSKKSKYEI